MQPAGATLARVGLFGFDILLLHAHRDAHAAVDAEPGEPLLGIALLHLVEERHHQRVHPTHRSGVAGCHPDRATAASCSSPARSFGASYLLRNASARSKFPPLSPRSATYRRLKKRAVAKPIANAPITKPHDAEA
jgi:hypothetical protein